MNDLVLKSYYPETPVMFLSSAQQDFFYTIGADRLFSFKADSSKQKALLSVFEEQIFAKLLPKDNDSQEFQHRKKFSILEAQDAFSRGEEESFLTYYVFEANSLSNVKVTHAEVDFTNEAKLALLKNIEANQKFIKDPNVYKSFNDIKNQLAPMEKPGETR